MDGNEIPGTPEIPGADLGDLVTIEEARKMIGLDKPPVTFDSGEDVSEQLSLPGKQTSTFPSPRRRRRS